MGETASGRNGRITFSPIGPISPIRGRLYLMILDCTPLPHVQIENEDDDVYENEAICRRSINQERAKIQPGSPFFVPLDGSTQKCFEHFFF
jgi:hypothetical protein